MNRDPGNDPGGRLIIVGTPIGNLGDLSPRAIEALAGADAVVCEDTRRTGLLLRHIGLDKRPLLVANEYTERARIVEIVDRLASGETIAVVTDAGMPGVSDPGQRIVQAAAAAGHRVDVVPGPTAAVSALVLSGLASDRFVFEGFLPRKGSQRADRLGEIGSETGTTVIYESPKRLVATLVDLCGACGRDRPAVVARELTKLHEEVVRGSLADLVTTFERREPRGEVVVVVSGAVDRSEPPSDDALLEALGRELEAGSSRRDAVTMVVEQTGAQKRRVYDLANQLGGP